MFQVIETPEIAQPTHEIAQSTQLDSQTQQFAQQTQQTPVDDNASQTPEEFRQTVSLSLVC